MRISIPQSGKNGTWHASIMLDSLEAAHLIGSKRALEEVRVSVRGNVNDGLTIQYDSSGRFKVNFSGSPSIRIPCEQFGFVCDGRKEHGIVCNPAEGRPGFLRIPLIPKNFISEDMQKEMALRLNGAEEPASRRVQPGGTSPFAKPGWHQKHIEDTDPYHRAKFLRDRVNSALRDLAYEIRGLQSRGIEISMPEIAEIELTVVEDGEL